MIMLVLSCNTYAFKIDHVIVATDANPTYLQFWPIVAKLWKQMGIEPTLALVADKNVVVDETIGEVIRFEPIPNISTGFQAQVIRLLLPIYFEDEVSLLSDIDMLPINKDYFVNSVRDISNEKFVVYRDKAYSYMDLYPMCYNAASGKVFKEIFNIQSIEQIPDFIRTWHALGFGWMTDEKVLYAYLNAWDQKKSD